MSNGRLSLGIATRDGVVIATDKKVSSPLIDVDNVGKISEIDKGMGFVYSGLGPDARVVVRDARKKAKSYALMYGSPKTVTEAVKSTASLMQQYTQSGGVRPFGCSILAAGMDEDGNPMLYQVDPSGVFMGWRATAIGKGYASAKGFLEKRWNEDMGIEDGIHTALLTMREGFEGEITGRNIEVGVLRKDTGEFKVLTEEEVQDYLNESS